MTRFSLLLPLLLAVGLPLRGDFHEDFETCRPGQNAAGQNGWQERAYGRHPSGQIVKSDDRANPTVTLQAAGPGDRHLFRRFTADERRSFAGAGAILLRVKFSGGGTVSLGNLGQYGNGEIDFRCGRRLGVRFGGRLVSGVVDYSGASWQEGFMLLTRQPDGSWRLQVAAAPAGKTPAALIADPAVAALTLPSGSLHPEKWTAVGVRIDNSEQLDDLAVTAVADPGTLPVKFAAPGALPVKFQPLLDHLLPPRRAVDLDGMWEAVPAPADSRTAPKTGWQTVLVPDQHSSLFSGKTPVVWFRRQFELKTLESSQCYQLCFERVTDGCEVWINGRPIGGSDDGFFPFRLDATAALRPGRNELLVRVAGTVATGGAKVRPSGWSWFLPQFNGIPYPVHLETVGMVGIDDVFVISRLHPRSELETRVTLINRGKLPATVTLSAAAGTAFRHHPSAPLTLRPGETREVVLRDAWEHPELWWPHRPHLYDLDLQLRTGDRVVDARRQRFGFREMQVRGPDLLLNGIRFMHRRDSIIPYWALTAETVQREQIARLRQRGFNGYRLHGGPSLRIIRTADELGWLVAPESGINEPRGHEVKPEFWPHAEKHIRNMVRTLRNHPSIIYWCLSNEFASYYMKGSDAEKAAVDRRLTELGRIAEQLDPVHIWTCSGDGELGGKGKHGPAPMTSFHYPSEPFKQHFTLPGAGWWLGEGGVSWHGIRWDRTKPLNFSEDLFMPYCIRPPAGMARWAGEGAYDLSGGYYRGWFDCIRMFAAGYYHDGLAVWNPWATAAGTPDNPLYRLGQPMPDYLLATREANVTFAAAEKVRRTLYVSNALFAARDCELRAVLTDGTRIVDTVTKRFRLAGGATAELVVTLPMPDVPGRRVLRWRAVLTSDGRELAAQTWNYAVYPVPVRGDAPAGCALLSSAGAVLNQVRFPAGRFTALAAALRSKPRSLVVAGWRSGSEAERKELNDAVTAGLNVLWLEPASDERLPLRRNPGERESFAFVRAPLDPAMKELADLDLTCWRPSGDPVSGPFFKPAEGSFDILADTGTGLRYTPLVRFYQGRGRYLFCSLPVVSLSGKEPAADWVARRLIETVDRVPRAAFVPLNAAGADEAVAVLRQWGIPVGTASGGRLRWVTASALDSAGLEEVRACCEAGGTVIVDGFDAAAARMLSGLTGESIKVEAVTATGLVKRDNRLPLLAGISNDDLYWRQKADFDTEANCRVTGRKYVSKDRPMIELAVVPGGRVTVPVTPGGVAVLPFRQGRVVMLTLKWREFVKIHPARVSRLITSLLHNLGAVTAPGTVAVREYRFVAMAGLMNREFWQRDARTPAWFGRGEDDLRYFPVNRPGIDPVLKLPQPPEMFPSAPLNCAGIDFHLVDPDRNGGRGCLVMPPGAAAELPVAGPCTALWLLGALDSHARNGQQVAALTFHYTDGSVRTVPVLAGVHVNGYQYIPEGSAVCGWTGPNPVRGDNVLWVWKAVSPDADKAVRAVTVKVGGERSLALIAATVEQR